MTAAPARWTDEALLGVDAVCVDLDGTLAEARWRQLRLWRELLAAPRWVGALGPAIRAARGARHADLDGALAAALAEATGGAPELHRRWLAGLLRARWPATFAGARSPPALDALLAASDDRGLPRAVFSDHPALAKLEAMGRGGWTAVVDGHALGALKPHPDGLFAVCAQLGVPPARLLYIGDRPDTDGAAAAAAGCRFLLVDGLGTGPAG